MILDSYITIYLYVNFSNQRFIWHNENNIKKEDEYLTIYMEIMQKIGAEFLCFGGLKTTRREIVNWVSEIWTRTSHLMGIIWRTRRASAENAQKTHFLEKLVEPNNIHRFSRPNSHVYVCEEEMTMISREPQLVKWKWVCRLFVILYEMRLRR